MHAAIIGTLLLLTVGARPAMAGQAVRVRYVIAARLDDSCRTLTGTEQILLWNDSIARRCTLRLHLYPNAFSGPRTGLARDLARTGRFDLALAAPPEFGSITLTRLEGRAAPSLSGVDTATGLSWVVDLAACETLGYRIAFAVRLPAPFLSLGCRGRAVAGGHWYPQLALGGPRSRLSPFGAVPGALADYEVSLTLPSDLRIAATGELVEPLDEPSRMTWPPGTRPEPVIPKTLRFVAFGVTDFAWFASPELILRCDSAWGVRVNCLPRQRSAAGWSEIPTQVNRMVWNYTLWYGPSPISDLDIVDASGVLAEDATFPGLVLVATRPNAWMRLQERAVANGVARQWFAGPVRPDPLADPWLANGPAAFSALRHLEAEHGPSNLLTAPSAIPMLAGLSDEYLSRVMFYAAATNGLSRQATTPADSFLAEPFSFTAVTSAQAALQLRALQNRLGEPVLDACLRDYLGRNRGSRTRLADLLAVLPESARQFLLADPGRQDYSLDRVRRAGSGTEIALRARPGTPLPATFEVRETDGLSRRHLWPGTPSAVTVPNDRPVRRVALDPDQTTVEPDRWNNSWPRSFLIRPFIALPDLDNYQLFYGPWFWYDSYHGLALGVWAQGRRFYDTGPFLGAHQWMVSETYYTRLNDWHGSLSYQTPLSFISDRLRIKLMGDISLLANGARAICWYDIGRPFRQPKATVGLHYRYWDLFDVRDRDPRAWDSARTAEARFFFNHSYEAMRFKGRGQVFAAPQVPWLGSNFRSWKFALEQQHTFRFRRNLGITVRGFAGLIWGAIPNQDQFYLSGGLAYTDNEPVSWAYRGWNSGQQHWHYDGDLNCRGYLGSYRHGRYAYGLNLSLNFSRYVEPFFDLGNVAQSPAEPGFLPPLMDAGLRFRLGPLYADIPFWRIDPVTRRSVFRLDWSLGFKLSDLGVGF